MKQIRIVRVEETDKGTLGVILIDGSLTNLYTLQPDSTDEHFHIPTGLYQCKRFHGKKYKDTFEIIVKGHFALLFHPGNTEVDTEGCILIGKSVGFIDGKRAVLSSVSGFMEFMAKLSGEQECSLLIEDKL